MPGAVAATYGHGRVFFRTYVTKLRTQVAVCAASHQCCLTPFPFSLRILEGGASACSIYPKITPR